MSQEIIVQKKSETFKNAITTTASAATTNSNTNNTVVIILRRMVFLNICGTRETKKDRATSQNGQFKDTKWWEMNALQFHSNLLWKKVAFKLRKGE